MIAGTGEDNMVYILQNKYFIFGRVVLKHVCIGVEWVDLFQGVHEVLSRSYLPNALLLECLFFREFHPVQHVDVFHEIRCVEEINLIPLLRGTITRRTAVHTFNLYHRIPRGQVTLDPVEFVPHHRFGVQFEFIQGPHDEILRQLAREIFISNDRFPDDFVYVFVYFITPLDVCQFQLQEAFHHVDIETRVFNFSANCVTTGTETAFPASLYRALSDMGGSLKSRGNPWRLKHSLGVSFRTPSPVRIRGTLCPPPPMLAVNVGHRLLLFSLT